MAKTYKSDEFVDAVRVSDGEAVSVPKSWLAKGSAYSSGFTKPEAAKDPEPQEVQIPDGDPSEDWKGEQLKAYAEKHGVDLAGATVKAAMVEAIAKAKGSEQS
ncbi:hypothetical protein ACI3EY_08005 [Ornithinimicrobium sp. LYQ92]|uniref:hypothetical protein n=1 Tax=Serinicoccus sp. LYQ92 TaxID=3378798 RepID=UPI003854B367